MYYTVKTESGVFQLLEEMKGDIQYFRIIDRTGKDCMQITYTLYSDDHDLTLSGVSYKPNCTMHMDMLPGKATRDMIKALLVFVMKSTVSMNDVAFLDQSSFDCLAMDKKHMFEVNLCLHNFILYGKTWYQRYFDAIPFYEDDLTKMSLSNKLLEQPYINVSFESFIKEVLRFSSNKEWINTVRNRLLKPFNDNQSISWRAFFNIIFDRTSDIACNLYEELRPYIQHKFIQFPFDELHMKIERTTIESYSEYSQLEFIKDMNPIHKKKIINTSDAILFLNGINYNSNSNYGNFLNNSETIEPMSGGTVEKRNTRKRKQYAIQKYRTYQMYMAHTKGRPIKSTRRIRRY